MEQTSKSPWRPMGTAPKTGRMLRLLVEPGPSLTSFEDSFEPFDTIGFNNESNTGEDRWEFAGWDWSHDQFCTGQGSVIGWQDFGPAEITVPTAVHIGWRWKHVSTDRWQFVEGTDHPQLGFTPGYEAGVTYEKVFTVEEQAPVAWWYEDKTGCMHMSLDIGLGLQHEAQFGYKLNWLTSTEPSRYFENFEDIARFMKIRRLCGYVENGSEQTVKIFQDDATREWVIKAGRQMWHAPSFSQVVDQVELPEDWP